MFECSWQKGKKKEYVEKNVQKKHNIDTKKKKKHVQKQKKKKYHNIESHWIYAIPAITYQYVIRHKMTQRMPMIRWKDAMEVEKNENIRSC